MKYLVVILLSICYEATVYAQSIIAEQMPFFYQLSSNEILDVYQDKEGYIWIGTTNGLNRYDGYICQSFKSDRQYPELLADNSIVSIADNHSHVWIGTGKGVNLFDKKTCRISSFPDALLRNKEISCIIFDQKGVAWIAAEGKIYKCNSQASVVKEYAVFDLTEGNIISIFEDSKGSIWLLTWETGLFKYDPQTDSFFSYPPVGEQNTPFTMYQDNAGNYWIGTWGDGLWQFFPDKEKTQCYKKYPVKNSKDGQPDPIIFSITQDNVFGYLWALSYHELYALKMNENGTLENVNIQNLVDTHKMYTKILKDREGNLWLGSYDMAYTIFFDKAHIKNYLLSQLKAQMGWDANIVNLCMDEDNVMWIKQDRYGLCLYDLSHDKLVYSDAMRIGGALDIRVIVKSAFNKGVWVSDRYDPRVMRLVQHEMKIRMEESISLDKLVDNPGIVKQLIEDNAGNLWIFTSTNLFVKPFAGQTITMNKAMPELSCLSIDPNGGICAVSSEQRIYQLSYSENHIASEIGNMIPVLSKQEKIANICIDEAGCIWAASSLGGIYKSDSDKTEFHNISLENRINNSSVLNLLSDRNAVWIITNKEAIRYDIYENNWIEYAASDENILVKAFRNKAVSLDGADGIFIGGHGGFVHIQSGTAALAVKDNMHLAITDVRTENNSLLFGNADNKNKFVNTIDNIYLSPQDRNIEIAFSALNYPLIERKRFAYKLDGVDNDWVYPDNNKHTAFYNRLNKGSYQFRLKTEYEPGKWTEGDVILTINKKPAIYETWYAYLIYVLLLGCCIYYVLHIYLRRVRLRDAIRFKEELTQTKLDYFTNVSHELLTPLTVMSGAVDYLDIKASSNEKQLSILRSNINRLKRLIQQILDFRKMEIAQMPLNVSYGNIAVFILNVCQTNFLPLAQRKNIDLRVSVPENDLWGYLDFDKVDKILYNLLSNAIKYTPENKQINVTAGMMEKWESRTLVIRVEDNGMGIPAEELEHVFTRFYNNNNTQGIESNGIGLSLTKDLLTIHHGTIAVESALGKGTCFTIELPVDKDSYQPEEIIEDMIHTRESETQREYGSSEKNEKYTILLVDDNAELLYLMKSTLEDSFNVATASGGKQAWNELNNLDANIVVCDVMMPDMNGWELCRRIKSDLRYNHLPVIILTAKNGVEDRIASYESGADGYIAKPFELKELLAQIDNLIRSYKIRQDAFRKEQDTNLDSMAHQSADKRFLHSVIQIIEQRLQESEFDLEQLSTALNMSKSTLHRKIKNITNLTPLDFVQNIKMKRACMMLQAGGLTISEVAYAVGFNDPKYFTKCFKNEFGITPSEYQKQT